MTFIWFVIWLIANNLGGHEPLLANPVNAWLGTLILAVALELVPQAFTRRTWRGALCGALAGAAAMLAVSALVGV
jgi:hypothetical protein